MNASSCAGVGMTRADVMNFLNEVAGRYPDAVSFASGRPAQQFFDFEALVADTGKFVQDFASRRGMSVEAAWSTLAQYGPTAGIINDLVARQAENDHGVRCQPGQIVITSGCQEALSLLVQTVCRQEGDVILARSPCYVGMTGVADACQMEVVPFAGTPGGQPAEVIGATVASLRLQGKRARLLYLVPDFDNPTGTVLSRDEREQILAACAAHDIIVLEDNPYGMFRYDGEAVPSMYSLDRHGCVIFLGTYSKTICPSVRVGFAALPATLFGSAEAASGLLAQLIQAKSFVTVNTGQLAQATVGALLLRDGCTLAARVAAPLAVYRSNRDHMLGALERAFGRQRPQVSWNRPEGGFFLTVRLPFAFRQDEALLCAQEYGVLVLPLAFFALDNQQDCAIRLAFSNVTLADIDSGVERLARFVTDRLRQAA